MFDFIKRWASNRSAKANIEIIKGVVGEGARLYYQGPHSSRRLVDPLDLPRLGDGRYSINLSDGEGSSWEAATFEMTQLPGCCGVCVSHGAWVNTQFRGKGLGTALNQLRKNIARANGYGLLICTDLRNNLNQRKVLKVNGWADLTSFINPKTSNKVIVSSYHL